MRQFMLLALFLLILSAGPAYATAPCQPPPDEDFAFMVNNTPLIVRGRMTGASGPDGTWTDIEILDILRGETDRTSLRIMNWSAVNPPLFNYANGSVFIFLLQPAYGDDASLLFTAWKQCVPGLMPGRGEDEYLVNMRSMSLEEFRSHYAAGNAAGQVVLTATIGPMNPVMYQGNTQPDSVPAVHYQFTFTNLKDGRLAAKETTDRDGQVNIALPAGDYQVDMVRKGITYAKGLPQTITVRPGEALEIEISIDSGIR